MDSDPIEVYQENNKGSNTPSVFEIIMNKKNTKLAIFVFILVLLINTDVFINRVLGRFKGAVNYKMPTTYGTVLQSLLVTIGFIIFNILISKEII